MPSKGLQGIVGLTMFLFLSNRISRKAGPFYVRAFSSGSATSIRRIGASGKTYAKTSRKGSQMASFPFENPLSSGGKCYSTTTSLRSGVVEQDLDSALDDLLQGTFDDVEEMDSGRTKEVSEFIPAETVSFICTTAPLSCCIWQH